MIRISVSSLKEGMVLGEPIIDERGLVLLNRGVKLTSFYISKLKKLGFDSVFIEDEDTSDIVVQKDIDDSKRNKAVRNIRKIFSIPLKNIRSTKREKMKEIVKNIETGEFKEKLADSPALKSLAALANEIVDDILNLTMLSGLVSIKRLHNFTYQHCVDTTVLSIAIADKFYYGKDQLKELAIGTMLHDIGRVLIDKSLYYEPRKLTEEELEIIKMHPTLGYISLKDVAGVGIIPAHIVYQHHERQDGKGYPRGLRGDNSLPVPRKFIKPGYIMPLAEIVYAANVYDALVSPRVYRAAYTPDQAFFIMKRMAGTEINKEVLRVFFDIVPAYPLGTTVIFTSGQYKGYIGVVSKINRENLFRPVVRILYNNRRKRIIPFEVNLLTNMHMSITGIII